VHIPNHGTSSLAISSVFFFFLTKIEKTEDLLKYLSHMSYGSMIFIDCRRSKEGMEAAISMGVAMLSSFAAPIVADALLRYSTPFVSFCYVPFLSFHLCNMLTQWWSYMRVIEYD
jgi:hypothetical protein